MILKKVTATLGALLALALSAHAVSIDDRPTGFAAQNGGTTGGSGGTVVVVTTLASLQTEAKSSGKKIIYVSGTMGAGVGTRVAVTSDKTIFGLPGSVLNGGMDVKGSNIIIRNMTIKGPGAVDVDGVDLMTLQEATNVWIDHCHFEDGQDGNFDIVNGSSYVTASWNKFTYTSKSSNHQFCNLIGNSDSKTTDRGKLKTTMQYNWWGTGVKERMPRVRFGQVHVVNNLFNSPGNGHCVRAGIEADLLVESNVFIGVAKPIDLYEGNYTAVTARNNIFTNTSGNTAGNKTAFTPPYTLTITPAANVEALIKGNLGAGATLCDVRTSNCGGTSSVTPSSSSIPVSSSIRPSSSSLAISSSVLSSSIQLSSSVQPSSSAVVPSSSSIVSSSSVTLLPGIEGESFCSGQGVLETKNAGYVGTGYYNFDNASNATGLWVVNASQAGQSTLAIRYANGTTAARSVSIQVNGTTVQASLSFPGTNAWTTWSVLNTNVNLNAGRNTILMTSLTADGGPNVDHFGFSLSGITSGSCDDPTPIWRPRVLLNSKQVRHFDLMGRQQ